MLEIGKATEAIDKGLGTIGKLQKLGLSLSQIILLGSLGVGLYYRFDWMKTHWRLVLAACLAYELFVFLIWITKPIWWLLEKITAEIQKRLEKQVVEAIVDWLFTLPKTYLNRFERSYRKQVLLDHEIFNVRGLESGAAHTLRLEHVFVDLKISISNNPQCLSLNPVAARNLASAKTTWDFIRATKDDNNGAIALAIIGPPGCGKTTLLQHVAITLASGTQHRYGIRAFTPLFLFLRDHISTIKENPGITLEQLAQSHFGDKKRFPKLNVPPTWFERKLDQGRCLVLLDGLDEVAQASEREAISHWVDQQLINYPNNRFVLTSRP